MPDRLPQFIQGHGAVLWTYDLRCAALTQRCSLGHRSLFPHLCCCPGRPQYVFTSHAGTALAVWDRRAMSLPLYEHRGALTWGSASAGAGWANDPTDPGSWGAGGCPFAQCTQPEAGPGGSQQACWPGQWRGGAVMEWHGGPAPAAAALPQAVAIAEPPRHRALWLDCDGDVLLGRADDGGYGSAGAGLSGHMCSVACCVLLRYGALC